MAKPSFLSPGSVVRVVGVNYREDGIIGYVARSKPTNGDDLIVGIIDGATSEYPVGQRLSFRTYHVQPVE